MKKNLKVLLYLHSGSLNRGCEALARTAVQVVKSEFPEAEVSVASYAPRDDQNLPDVKEVFDMNFVAISKKSLDYLQSAIAMKLNGDETVAIRKANKKFIQKIPEYDLFLSIGGDAYCYGEQPIWYELNRQIKKAGKKMVLWGCSIGEEDLSENKIQDLKNYDLVLARESLTENLLKTKGLHQTKLVADGAFLMEKDELPFPKNWIEGKMVGMNFSPLVYKRNNAAKEAFEKLVQHILETTDYHIAFTPHVTISGNNDYEILHKIFKKFENTGRVLILPDNLNALQYKGYIARMKFFIGARTHATIAAYSNAVPVMVLGYSVKSKGIAKDLFGEEKLVLGIDEISDSEKLIEKFEELKNEETSIRERLQKILPEIKAKAQSSGKYLRQII